VPPSATLFIRAIRNKRSNCGPIVAEFPYRFNQLCVFFRCPFTRKCCGLPTYGVVQIPAPPLGTLLTIATRNQGGNSGPNLAAFLYHFNQLCVFFRCPFAIRFTCTGPSTRSCFLFICDCICCIFCSGNTSRCLKPWPFSRGDVFVFRRRREICAKGVQIC
jgi:hypothetical protein